MEIGVDRFDAAVAAFARANAADPHQLMDHGVSRPREVVQAERLAAWIDRVAPNASEPLRLAAHCQHLCRWEIPRATYPEGRTGYLQWRKDLSRFHASRAGEILRSVGYDDAIIERVADINQKRALKLDPDVQTMEDALCLAFLEHELEDFSTKHAPDLVVDILKKSWRKMSDAGHERALALPLSESVKPLVLRALAS